MTRPPPRPPKRHRVARCYDDCQAQETGEGADCDCADRDDAAYDAECEARLERWLEGDYDELDTKD